MVQISYNYRVSQNCLSVGGKAFCSNFIIPFVLNRALASLHFRDMELTELKNISTPPGIIELPSNSWKEDLLVNICKITQGIFDICSQSKHIADFCIRRFYKANCNP